MCLVGCAGAVDPPRQAADPELVVALMGEDEDKMIPYCGGVWVAPQYILTAAHCVEDKKEVLFIMHDEERGWGKLPRSLHLGVVDKRGDQDIALIKSSEFLHHPVAELSQIKVGEKVVMYGHPAGLGWSLVPGSVAGYRDSLPVAGNWMQLSAPIYFGMSGGGVFDEQGRLVGLVSFMFKAPNTGFAIPASVIRDFI